MTALAYQLDGAPCTAGDFYAHACDPARSVVVEACAGAGKTWMLVSRIVRALLAGAAPGEILAITFTRKAAGEMRSRLHEWLREWSACDETLRIEALVQRGLTSAEARQAAPQLALVHAHMLRDGEQVQISTFHAWFAQLLRWAPIETLDVLGLHAGMELVEEIDDLRPALMHRFQRAVSSEQTLLADYQALMRRHRRSRMADWFEVALDRRTEIELADARGALEGTVKPASTLWPECAGLGDPVERVLVDADLRDVLQVAARALAGKTGVLAQGAAESIGDALNDADARAAWARLKRVFFTTQGEPRKLMDGVAESRLAIEALQRLEEQVTQHEAHDDHQRMCRLTRALLAEWRMLKRERSLVDMSDLEHCALAVLSDSVAAGWVQERLDRRFRHVLIDEFQDTSPLQWQALQAWLGSYAGAGGGASGQRPPSVFIVGDPKQSIYRFRRAEPRVFVLARDFIVQGLTGHALSCNHTRRCASAVIDALNVVFGQAAAQGEFDGFVAHSTAVDTVRRGAVWRLAEPADPPTKAALPAAAGWRDSLTMPRVEARERRAVEEARRVARAVAHLVHVEDHAPQQVLVLARRRATLAIVADELRALHLPCAAAESLQLGGLVEVTDLVAVLDVLASPGHALSLAQALKCPLFGVTDDELLALANRAAELGGVTPWWSALMQWADAPAAVDRAAHLLGSWAQHAKHLPPHDLLDRIVHEGDLLARLAQVVPPERRVLALAAVQALLEQSLSLDGGRHLSIYRFVRALKQRALSVPAPARTDAVRLMTIHGAKGLEARAVFIVDAEANPAREHMPAVMVDWPVAASAPTGVAFVSHARTPPPSLVAWRAQEQQAAAREELNALYVAMTRAEQTLVFSRTVPRHAATQPSWWSRLQGVAQASWPLEAPLASSLHAVQASVPQLPVWRSATKGQRLPGPSANDDQARRLGRAVHRALQWTARATDLASALARCAPAAVGDEGLDASLTSRVVIIVTTMRRSPALARFFDPSQLLWAGDEVELVHNGELLRIDRLVRIGPQATCSWWVLDYKLDSGAADDPRYWLQLSRYRDAVAARAAPEPVHAAIATADGRLHTLI